MVDALLEYNLIFPIDNKQNTFRGRKKIHFFLPNHPSNHACIDVSFVFLEPKHRTQQFCRCKTAFMLAVFGHSKGWKCPPALVTTGLDFTSAKCHPSNQPEVPAKLWTPHTRFLLTIWQTEELILVDRNQQISRHQQSHSCIRISDAHPHSTRRQPHCKCKGEQGWTSL